jgi:3-oxoacyl-ACP reductase-like protein
MSIRSDWAIGREGIQTYTHILDRITPANKRHPPGFTFDTVISLLKHTVFDPRKTIPLYLAALYTTRGNDYFATRPEALKWLRRAIFGGLFFRVKRFLDEGVANNWKSDTYNWNKEVVAVTGGSDGIGAKMVQMLASKGIKVVVLDIQEPKYICEFFSSICSLLWRGSLLC